MDIRKSTPLHIFLHTTFALSRHTTRSRLRLLLLLLSKAVSYRSFVQPVHSVLPVFYLMFKTRRRIVDESANFAS